MLKRERQKAILELLDKERQVSSSELIKKFKCSEDTIRRDLRELDQQGLLKRIYNGAIRIGPPITTFEQRLSVNVDAKKKIAQKTLQFLKEDSLILIDGGTTNYYLAQEIPDNFSATVITNSPYITIQLLKKKYLNIITLGGIFAKRAAISLGVETVDALSTFRIDTYIMGIHNFHPEVGVTMHSQQEALIKSKMVKSAEEVIAPATSDKLGVYSSFICCKATQVDQLVTDSKDIKLLKKFKKKNVSIEYV
ncbi:DeoR/GlpR family DNA-binding transcription regulator [Lactobacillus sp. ESL0791]|uniref:DeoR/GlpR family DNA-binding transcription regulator n=1 Tax=Lactobacillus sp. ESL0791 TaxID=2983234 RepID=UPI0023F88EE2|nr:DeoR/GlpR family DNA-binding transcription regulator [Lactobacillus sp. ESL0791]MDF7639554.1 DeoR/GlpR family DNA-binding transcription regulator [Lactobacillus sp. ESL0791]